MTAPKVDLNNAGYWNSPEQCMAATEIVELHNETVRLKTQLKESDEAVLLIAITMLHKFGLTGKDADDYFKGEYRGRD